ncbi:MAG: hypothetical protein QOD73_1426 [Solirubrobacteraceae bacterium]|jgi:hypothetical protein|nr:hypothetical protein [Solirubrobacteraceae bacterium]
MAEEEDPRADEAQAPMQKEGAGDEGLGTRTGAVDGPQEGGPGLGDEEGTGGESDIGVSGRGRH